MDIYCRIYNTVAEFKTQRVLMEALTLLEGGRFRARHDLIRVSAKDIECQGSCSSFCRFSLAASKLRGFWPWDLLGKLPATASKASQVAFSFVKILLGEVFVVQYLLFFFALA